MPNYNMKHENIINEDGVMIAKCLCKACRKNRSYASIKENVKPDLSREVEMKRREEIYKNKDIW